MPSLKLKGVFEAIVLEKVTKELKVHYTLDGRGGIINTPSIQIDDKTRIGKFALSDGDVQVGFRIQNGDMGKPTVLYPVDTSALDRTTAISWNNKKVVIDLNDK